MLAYSEFIFRGFLFPSISSPILFNFHSVLHMPCHILHNSFGSAQIIVPREYVVLKLDRNYIFSVIVIRRSMLYKTLLLFYLRDVCITGDEWEINEE